MQIKDLTTEEFKTLMRETLTEILQDSLDDPDYGLTVKESVKQQLLDIKQRRKSKKVTISAEEVAEKIGLKW
ncbi:MAG TPA: hypothetical protein V6C58_02050 [Allocoleopsis sp.]